MCNTGRTTSEIWDFDINNTKRKLSEIWDLDSKFYAVVEIGLSRVGSRGKIARAVHLHLLQFYTYPYIYLYPYRLLLTTTSILLLPLRLLHADYSAKCSLSTTPYMLHTPCPTSTRYLFYCILPIP